LFTYVQDSVYKQVELLQKKQEEYTGKALWAKMQVITTGHARIDIDLGFI
jgi:hypothetical protein